MLIEIPICEHTIPMKTDAKLVYQRPYPMNPKYDSQIQEEINKLIESVFIYEIENLTWILTIVVAPKKNGKLRVSIDLKKVNAATCHDHLSSSEHVLKRVAGKEAYSFLDGYSSYNQISVVEEDQPKTTFIIEYGLFAFNQMPFGLTNVLAHFKGS